MKNESSCKACGDLCGDDVDCRVWNYEGAEYTEPPKELIINAILKAVYGEKTELENEKAEYKLPDNLNKFFDALDNEVKAKSSLHRIHEKN